MSSESIHIPSVPLAHTKLNVGQISLGCMGMSEFYGPADEAESLAVIDAALKSGVNFFDTADVYGNGKNEELLGKAMKGRRDQFIVATKFGGVRDEQGKWIGFNASPDYVKFACDRSLQKLGTNYIDLYYLHRVDPKTPIEDTVRAMAELVKEGKVKHLGLSEVNAKTLRRAHAVHPITAVQTEYSLWTRDPESDGVLATCRELGIALIAYSPLGRGFLTGQFKSPDDLAADDWRRNNPRFQGENFQKNLELVEKVKEIAASKGATPAQLALAWLLAQGKDIIPIPGTKRVKYLLDNLGAVNVHLTADDMQRIKVVLDQLPAAGTRYDAGGMRALNL